MPTVLVRDHLHECGRELIGRWATLVYDPERRTPLAQHRHADGLIVRGSASADELQLLDRLKAIVRPGAGLDGIALDFAQARGIAVRNTPGVNADAVAEYVFAALLQVARDLPGYDLGGDAAWSRRDLARGNSYLLRGKRLGVVGFGEIGRRVVDIGHFGFGMQACTSLTTPRPLPGHVRNVPLRELCASSQFLVVACSLTEATRGRIGREELALLPPDGVFVNVARGAVVDEQALLEFVATPRRRTTLVLDVHHQSPLPDDHPCVRASRVLLTPHLAALTQDTEEALGREAASVMAALLDPAAASSSSFHNSFRRDP